MKSTTAKNGILDKHEPWIPSDREILGLMRVPLFDHRRIGELKLAGSDCRMLCSEWSPAGIEASGPPLGTYDEDTLLGLFWLCNSPYVANQERRRGKAAPQVAQNSHPGPVPTIPLCTSLDPNETYHFRISQLDDLLARSESGPKGRGGCTLAKRVESFELLSETTLSFRYYEEPEWQNVSQSPPMKLFERLEKGEVGKMRFAIRTAPMAIPLMTHYVSRIDLSVRRGLSPLGKALHRVLASHAHWPRWEGRFETLLDAMGVHENFDKAKFRTREQIDRMIRLGFLREATFKRGPRLGGEVLQVVFSQQQWWLGNPFSAMADATGCYGIDSPSSFGMSGTARVLDFSNRPAMSHHRDPQVISRVCIDDSTSADIEIQALAHPSPFLANGECIEEPDHKWSGPTAPFEKDRDGTHGHNCYEFPDGARDASASLGILLELAIKVNTELNSWLLNTGLATDKPQRLASSPERSVEPVPFHTEDSQERPLNSDEFSDEEPVDLLGVVSSLGITLQQLAGKNAVLYRRLSSGQESHTNGEE